MPSQEMAAGKQSAEEAALLPAYEALLINCLITVRRLLAEKAAAEQSAAETSRQQQSLHQLAVAQMDAHHLKQLTHLRGQLEQQAADEQALQKVRIGLSVLCWSGCQVWLLQHGHSSHVVSAGVPSGPCCHLGQLAANE